MVSGRDEEYVDERDELRLSRRAMLAVTGGLAGLVTLGGVSPAAAAPGAAADQRAGGSRRRDWLAGDHHIHSEFSVGLDNSTSPPTPIIGGDGRYPIATNAGNARRFGLRWMVSTDHGGPNHSKINVEQAYPSLLASRRAVPQVLQFYGMELDTPAADHSSLIIPKNSSERDVLRDLESRFSAREVFPTDPARNTEPKMLEALRAMRAVRERPVLFANHPSLGVIT